MKKRLFAALLALSLSAILLSTTASAYTPKVDIRGQKLEDMTPEQQKQALLEWMLFYAATTPPFEDVPSDSWAYAGVDFVWRNGLMSGVSETRFAPNEPTNRAMVWTVLARLQGEFTPAAEGQQWYEPGARWVAEHNLDDGSNPMGSITREYLAGMLWRCAGGPFTPADLSGFSDYGQVSDYAIHGVRWAVTNGILQGSGGQLSPQGGLTRAELAAMVMRFGFLQD